MDRNIIKTARGAAASLALVSLLAVALLLALYAFTDRPSADTQLALAPLDEKNADSDPYLGYTPNALGASVPLSADASGVALAEETTTPVGAVAPAADAAPPARLVPIGPVAPNPDPIPDPGEWQPPAVGLSALSGQVVHEVWGTPVVGVRIVVSPSGRSVLTDSLGFFAFDDLAPGTPMVVWIDTAHGSWLSSATTARAWIPESGTRAWASFDVYASSEAHGQDWRNAAGWRRAANSELAAAVSRVSAGSTLFDGLSITGANTILDAGRNGSHEERARAELLATWLDLASARLGFDTRVDIAQVPHASAQVAALPGDALSLARTSDAAVASGTVSNWGALERALSDRSLPH